MRLHQHHTEPTHRGIQRHAQTRGAATNDCQIVGALLLQPRQEIGTRSVQGGVVLRHGKNRIAPGYRCGTVHINLQAAEVWPKPPLPPCWYQRTLPSFQAWSKVL